MHVYIYIYIRTYIYIYTYTHIYVHHLLLHLVSIHLCVWFVVVLVTALATTSHLLVEMSACCRCVIPRLEIRLCKASGT